MLKPGYKTSEGIGFYGILAAAMPIIGYLAGVDFDSSDTDKLMEVSASIKATTVDVSNWYKATQASIPAYLESMGKFGGMLYFVYKVYSKYVDKRTELKKIPMEKPDAK